MKMEKKKLGKIATYVNGYAFKPTDWRERGLPIIRIQDLTGSSYQLNYYDGDYPKKIEINNGDVLISWSASLGVYIWDRGKALLNQHIFKVVFDKEEIVKEFFVYAVKFNLTTMLLHMHGATMKHIVKKDFDNIEIPYPSIKKQKEAAQVLSKVEALISKRKQQLDDFDNLIKSRFVEMFGNPVSNTKEWEMKTVIDECDCMVPGRDKPKSFTGNIPWITIDDLQVNGITLDSKKGMGLTQNEIDDVKRKAVPAGSVLMSCVGNLGICSIAGKDLIINQQLHSFQCKNKLNNYYLMHYLGYRTDYMNKHASSTTVLYMNKGVCNSIPLMLPPIDLQNEFSTFVRQVDKLKYELRMSLNETQLLFDSLMQKYFE
jgi:type I restriction enzyme S subunit